MQSKRDSYNVEIRLGEFDIHKDSQSKRDIEKQRVTYLCNSMAGQGLEGISKKSNIT